jgi:hypothetical protein
MASIVWSHKGRRLQSLVILRRTQSSNLHVVVDLVVYTLCVYGVCVGRSSCVHVVCVGRSSCVDVVCVGSVGVCVRA